MTKAQQAEVDKFHEKVITLIYKRRSLQRSSPNNQAGWDALTVEIEEMEDARRAYEKSIV